MDGPSSEAGDWWDESGWRVRRKTRILRVGRAVSYCVFVVEGWILYRQRDRKKSTKWKWRIRYARGMRIRRDWGCETRGNWIPPRSRYLVQTRRETLSEVTFSFFYSNHAPLYHPFRNHTDSVGKVGPVIQLRTWSFLIIFCLYIFCHFPHLPISYFNLRLFLYCFLCAIQTSGKRERETISRGPPNRK